MKSIINSLFFAAILSLAVSCASDPRAEWHGRRTNDKVVVCLNMRTPGGFTKPAATRLSHTEENTLEDIHVLIFDQNDRLTGLKQGEDIKYLNPSNGEFVAGSGSFSLSLDPSSGNNTSKLVVLANLSAGMKQVVQNFMVDAAYTEAMSAIWEEVTGPLYAAGGLIPMWGETGQFAVTPANANQSVSLMRAAARIDVGVGTASKAGNDWTWDGKDGDGVDIPFTMTAVYVMRPADKMAVVPLAANIEEGKAKAVTYPAGTSTYSVGESVEKFCFSNDAITGGLYTTRSIYIPETEVVLGGIQSDERHTDRAAIVVGGIYGGQTGYYRIDIAPGGELKDVLRNHLYRFSITDVSGAGYGTPEEAYAAFASNIEVSILAWKEDEIGDFEFDGTYHFGITSRSVEFTSAGNQTRILTIDTNIPDFGMSLAGSPGDILLKAGDPALQTYDGTDFIYTLEDESGGIYSLTIETKAPNVSPGGEARLEEWTILASRMKIPFSVDQQWGSTYLSFNSGRGAAIVYPEGSDGATIPLEVVASGAVTVTIADADGNSDPDWISGSTAVGESGGVWSARLEFAVAPFKYGKDFDGTTNRTAVITVAVAGESEATKYTVTQEAPRLAINPVNFTLARPAEPAKVVQTVTIETNLRPADLAIALGGSDDPGAGRVSLHSEAHPAIYDAAIFPRYRRFDVTADLLTDPVPAGGITVPFTVTPGGDYGVEAISGYINVRSAVGSTFDFYWYRSAYPAGEYIWTAPTRYNDGTDNYIFPWYTEAVEFDIVSDMGRVDVSTTEEKNGGSVSFGTGVTSAGLTRTPVLFTFNAPPDYTAEHAYTLRFEPETEDEKSIVKSFKLAPQKLSHDNTEAINYDYKAQAARSVAAVTHNVNWTAASDADWLTLRAGTTGDYTETATQAAGRTTAPGTTAAAISPALPLQATTTALTLNLLSEDDYKRTATVSFTNDDLDGEKGGAEAPADITITQYAPRLTLTSTTLPVDPAKIPRTGATYTITATTNLQGWGVKVYSDTRGDGMPASNTLLASSVFGTSTTIAADAEASERSVAVTIPYYLGFFADRDLRFVLYCTEFTGTANEVEIGTWQQEMNSAPDSYAVVLFLDGNGRLQVDKYNGRTVTTSNMVYTQFGSLVGFGIDDVLWNNTSSLNFNPTTTTSYAYTSIPEYNQALSNYGPSVSSTSYHFYNNVKSGRGDICKLVGYTAVQVRNWTTAQFNTATSAAQWRLPTAVENARFVGGPSGGAWSTWANGGTLYSYSNASYNYRNNPNASGISDNTISVPVVAQTGRPAFSEHLPAGGYRDLNGTRQEVGTVGQFWSSTPYNNTDGYRLNSENNLTLFPVNTLNRRFGMAIRCVPNK